MEILYHIGTTIVALIASVAIMKTDLSWIKRIVEKHELRLDGVDIRLNNKLDRRHSDD